MRSKPTDFITAVDRTTLTSEVCRKLMSHLVRGDWNEGDRIPSERELCEMLGVGRASLREALKALEIMGMIEVRVGNGTFVCHRSEFLYRPLLWATAGNSPSDIKEMAEARSVLEKELAELAAERATTEDLAEIEKYLDLMEKSVSDPVSFLEADLNFHLAIASASHNSILLTAVQLIRNLMQQWMGHASGVQGVPTLAVEQHRGIFLAIAERNRAEARRRMTEHLVSMAEALMTSKYGSSAQATDH